MTDPSPPEHPFLPSGTWVGFYIYGAGAASPQHEMDMWLNFNAGDAHGSGMDDVGYFTWQGTYDLQIMNCSMFKHYGSHQVRYQGCIDENGIWGQWTLGIMRGGFHIWPKKHATEKQAEQAKLEVPTS